MPDGTYESRRGVADQLESAVEDASRVIEHLQRLGCSHARVVVAGHSRVIYGYALRHDPPAVKATDAISEGHWYDLRCSDHALVWAPHGPLPASRGTLIQHLR